MIIDHQYFDTVSLTLLSRFFASLQTLRKPKEHIPTSQILLLLDVARSPGLGASEYGRRLGVAQAVTSRDLISLGPRKRDGSPGLGLVEAYRDPVDFRKTHYYLTGQGKRLIAEVVMLMKGGL